MSSTTTEKTQVDAAMYVRMSTESQNYSTDHQRAKIRKYAVGAGLRIVREYADEGKSGLCVFHANWTPVPPQTGQSFQRKLDTCSMPNWTPWA